METNLSPHERMSRSRLFAGFDQTEMARILGKSRNTISAWERGVNEPSVTDVARWALITGQSIEWIVWGDDVRPKGLEPLTFWSVVMHGTSWTDADYMALQEYAEALT